MTKQYAVMIETAGGYCHFPATGLTLNVAKLALRQIAEADMREMGLGADEIEAIGDDTLLAPGGIYSVTEQDDDLDALLAERAAGTGWRY